jgi:predicted dehydrogenase
VRRSGVDAHEPITIAVIGAGYWGNNLIRNAHACAHTRQAWVCDAGLRRAERATVAIGTVALNTELAEVLAGPVVDAGEIATHHSIAMSASAPGQDVPVEKPLVSTFPEGQEMVAEAERRGLVLLATTVAPLEQLACSSGCDGRTCEGQSV